MIPRRDRLVLVVERLRVLIVAGVATGMVVIGLGGRFAMFALRVTSPDHVRGVTSDDGFSIGRFTLGGTYNLVMIGGFVGVIGAAAYRCVRPWLLGGRRFQLLTLALGSGAVVGSMLVHADGVDFTLLKPAWFAVGLFVALPAAFAVAIAAVVDRVERPGSWTRRRPWAVVVPLTLIALVPPVLIVAAIAAVVLLVWAYIWDDAFRDVRRTRGYGLVVRALWLSTACAGLIRLLDDIVELRAAL